MPFDRKIFFDSVRGPLFGGALTQQQVDGMNAILDEWDKAPLSDDLRHLAYPLATTKHETSSTMWPIEEYGKGQGMSYGKPDPETGQTYYGRGYVQLTWRDNYAKADKKLGLSGDRSCEWHAQNALDKAIAADIMFRGMWEGWFRTTGGTPNTLLKYFSDTMDDPFNARDIINGDRNTIPSWSHGVSIGKLIAEYHDDFLEALEASWMDVTPKPPPEPEPEPEPTPEPTPQLVTVGIQVAPGTQVAVYINGQQVLQAAAANGGEVA